LKEIRPGMKGGSSSLFLNNYQWNDKWVPQSWCKFAHPEEAISAELLNDVYRPKT